MHLSDPSPCPSVYAGVPGCSSTDWTQCSSHSRCFISLVGHVISLSLMYGTQNDGASRMGSWARGMAAATRIPGDTSLTVRASSAIVPWIAFWP
jgi:hypothetical protein